MRYEYNRFYPKEFERVVPEAQRQARELKFRKVLIAGGIILGFLLVCELFVRKRNSQEEEQ